jgi:hypothetical protein
MVETSSNQDLGESDALVLWSFGKWLAGDEVRADRRGKTNIVHVIVERHWGVFNVRYDFNLTYI